MLLKVDLTQRRRELEKLLLICQSADQHKYLLEEGLYNYFSLYDPGFIELLKVFFHEDPSALKWIEFFDIDLKQLKIDMLALDFKKSSKKQIAQFVQSVIDLLIVQRTYLFPLLERI